MSAPYRVLGFYSYVTGQGTVNFHQVVLGIIVPPGPGGKLSRDVPGCEGVVAKTVPDQASNWGQGFPILDLI